MSRVVVAHGCGRTPAALAGEVAGWLATRRLAFEVLAIDGADHTPPACERLVVVFPVLGDERIPDPVDAWLERGAPASGCHAIAMTGDFRSETTAHPAAMEADRLLGASSAPLAAPLLVDTPLAPEHARPTMHDWLDAIWGGEGEAGRLPAEPPPPVDDARLQAPIRELLELLPAAPRLELDPEGRCVGLALVSTAPYPRSLLADGVDVARVLELAARVPELRMLGVSFAGLRAVPEVLPPRLLALDLRGNPLTRFRGLRRCRGLRALNLAACDLAAIPDEIRALPLLHTLVLAKNRLSALPPWLAAHTALERLTLYRNRLARIDPTIADMRRLRVLNLGANPIAELPEQLGTMRCLETLGLRLVPLPRAPAWLETAPGLRAVDASKTAFAHAAPCFVDGMPRWQWDDVARHAVASEDGRRRPAATAW